MNSRRGIICIAVTILLAAASCSHDADKARPLGPNAAPAAADDNAAGAAPAENVGGAGSSMKGVTAESFSGRADFSTIKSSFPCKTDSDCTYTKYHNAPKSTAECTCQAPCEPYVVNVSTRDARKEANERLCKNDDWFGPKCPAPACSFLEFDRFSCVDSKCEAADLNGE